MDAWLIVVITISSGLVLFITLFCIKLKRNRRRGELRNASYTTEVVVQAPQASYHQQQMPYPQHQQMPYPQHQQMPYPQHQNQQMPYPQHQNQQMPYPPQQQPNYPTQTQALSFVPSTSHQPAYNPQNPQPYYNPQGVIVTTTPLHNPAPSAPPENRY